MNIIVIGGGAAGLMAAGTAAEQGAQVTLLETNEKVGRKLFITGKGRCNAASSTAASVLFKISSCKRQSAPGRTRWVPSAYRPQTSLPRWVAKLAMALLR